MSTTWTRRITVTYREEKRSETSETTTTAILVEGPPLVFMKELDFYTQTRREMLHTEVAQLKKIEDLFVPKGQEVVLTAFHQPFHGLQLLTFRTICDHGD
jgi:hypothetical protein